MMRSWGNRDDTVVVDEPLYAHYLYVTRKAHPGIDDVIASGDTDWQRVVAGLIGPIPGDRRIYYQKHMTHHLLPQMGRVWLVGLTNCFLIRHPREVLASYTKVIETPAIEDLGFVQQSEIFDQVRTMTGSVPSVLDAADVLRNPRRMIGLLCDALGVNFQESMLNWPAGPRSTDGVWAKYWYAEVEKSTGFRPYQTKQIELPERLNQLCKKCTELYEQLHSRRIR
jgi:hypothetical protein